MAKRTVAQIKRDAADRQRVRSNAHFNAGKCIDCGRPATVHTARVSLCKKCNDKRKARQKQEYENCKRDGLCFECKGPSRPGKTLCEPCTQGKTASNRNLRRRTKLIVLAYFGQKCAHCTETDIRVLTLDHVNGDGNAHRKEVGDSSVRVWRDVAKQIERDGKPARDCQLLCYNCHAKKDLTQWWLR